MSRFPPDLQFGFLAIATHAVPGTFVTSAIVAAPAAGQRLRIWTVGMSPNGISMAIPQQLMAIWLDVASGANLWNHSQAGSVLQPIQHQIPGGHRMTANSGLSLFHGDSAASQPFRAWAHYTVEQAA